MGRTRVWISTPAGQRGWSMSRQNAKPSLRATASERVFSAEVHAEDVSYHARGSKWTLCLAGERVPVTLPLIGDFNVINALGAAATVYALGICKDDALRYVETAFT